MQGSHEQLMNNRGLYYSLVTAQMNSKAENELAGQEVEEEEVIIEEDALQGEQVDEADMPSLISIGSFTGTFGRKKSSVGKLDRRISVLSNYSTYR